MWTHIKYFILQQNWRNGPKEGGCREEMAQTMYIHVSKCKNGKTKGEKKISFLLSNQ
jgi:hypothetical protein